MSKERPIIMTSENVRAILDGRKTQTRRVIKPQPPQPPEPTGKSVFLRAEVLPNGLNNRDLYACVRFWYDWNNTGKHEDAVSYGCPYGVVGDRLWVREGWRCTGGGDLRNIIYRADGDSPMSFCGVDDGRTGILHVPEPYWAEWDRLVYKTNRGCNWRSPIHMYKWATRLWLEITGIRVERAQDISWQDCKAEGITLIGDELVFNNRKQKQTLMRTKFKRLWDSINYKRGYPWSDEELPEGMKTGHGRILYGNPWVWIVEFRKAE